ncbi:hypothetical protein HNS03_19775 [Amorphus sp. 3PC139-8]
MTRSPPKGVLGLTVTVGRPRFVRVRLNAGTDENGCRIEYFGIFGFVPDDPLREARNIGPTLFFRRGEKLDQCDYDLFLAVQDSRKSRSQVRRSPRGPSGHRARHGRFGKPQKRQDNGLFSLVMPAQKISRGASRGSDLSWYVGGIIELHDEILVSGT